MSQFHHTWQAPDVLVLIIAYEISVSYNLLFNEHDFFPLQFDRPVRLATDTTNSMKLREIWNELNLKKNLRLTLLTHTTFHLADS